MKGDYVAFLSNFAEAKISYSEYQNCVTNCNTMFFSNREKRVYYSFKLMDFFHSFIDNVKQYIDEYKSDQTAYITKVEIDKKLESLELCWKEFSNDARSRLFLVRFLDNILYVPTLGIYTTNNISLQILCDMLNDKKTIHDSIRSIFWDLLSIYKGYSGSKNKFIPNDFIFLMNQLDKSNIALTHSTLTERINAFLLKYLNIYFIKNLISFDIKTSISNAQHISRRKRSKFFFLAKYLNSLDIEINPVMKFWSFILIISYKYINDNFDMDNLVLTDQLDHHFIDNFLKFLNQYGSHEILELTKFIFHKDADGKLCNLSKNLLTADCSIPQIKKDILGNRSIMWSFMQAFIDFIPLLDENILNITYMRSVCANYFFNDIDQKSMIKNFLKAATINCEGLHNKTIKIFAELLNGGFVEHDLIKHLKDVLGVKRDFCVKDFISIIPSSNDKQHMNIYDIRTV